MDPKLIVFIAICKAVCVLILINLIGFGLMLVFTDDITQIGFKHGVFSVNGAAAGINVFSLVGRILLAAIFLFFVLFDLKKAKRSA